MNHSLGRVVIVALVAAVLPTLSLTPAASAEPYGLFVSASADRSNPAALDGTTQSGSIYVFTQPTTGVARVRFYLDDPTMVGAPRQVERGVPHDFAGTANNGDGLPFRTGNVSVGSHVITAAIDLTAGGTAVLSATFTVEHEPPAPSIYDLVVSSFPERTNPESLDGAEVGGSIYVFTTPETDVRRVRFFLDDPTMSGSPVKTEGGAPYDLAGTTASGNALPYGTEDLAGGEHNITAAVEKLDGSVSAVSATFTVGQSEPRPDLTTDKDSITMSGVMDGEPVRSPVSLGTGNGATVSYATTASVPWLSADPQTGSAPRPVEIVAAPGSLAPGTHTGTVQFTADGYNPVSVTVTLVVSQTAGGPYDVVMSSSSKRTSPQPLDGKTVSGSIYAFLSPESGVSSTSWWLDDVDMQGKSWRVDGTAPYDFMPNSKPAAAVALKTPTLPDGTHTVTVEVTTDGGEVHVVTSTFITDNDTNSLTWTPDSQAIDVDPGTAEPVTFTAQLTATKPDTVASLSGGEPYLTTDQGPDVTTPSSVQITVDPRGLSPGSYTFRVTAAATGAFNDVLTVQVNVGDSQGCLPIACELIRVDQPYVLPFDGDQGLMVDRNGVGTGFTKVLSRDGGGYLRGALELDAQTSVLKITAGDGSFKTTENTQENAVGVGFNGGAINVVTTTLTNFPTLSGNYEQAGLWFGYDQDHVMKLDFVSTPNGPRVEQVLEVGGVIVASKQGALLNLAPGNNVILSVKADPVTRKLTGSYRVNSGASAIVASMDAPGEFFSADAAGIDPRVGTRTFAGVYASKRNAPTEPVFEFGDFSVTGEPVSVGGDMEFTRKSHDVPFPTSMVFGPDGRLYVLTLRGDILVLTYDDTHAVVDEQTITTLGQRLALGIAIDPASTADNVALWISHSSPSLASGEADSGMVTRLSGPDFGTREDVITGLPRSIANHGPNSLHFGPDGRLFMSVGGNTGAGAANTAATEFGDRGEQPLSGGLLVADVKAAGFDGACADPADMYSSDDCDVQVFSSGLRNTYDFTFHSNGHIYGPDNGLGVVGSYPPTATPPCTGFGSTVSYKNGGNNPGEQPDELNLLVEGGYYGHPNPTRQECVFGDGSYQDVAPLPNFQPPMHDLGKSRSANGIIEYTGDAFCGSLSGNLLLTNYSVGDDIVSLRLSADGTSVLQTSSLVSGLSDPLPLVEAADGSLVVGEFAGGKVTMLSPVDTGCWTEGTPLPTPLLDAGGTSVGDDIYVVGGKTPTGPQSTVYKYDVSAGTWSTVADLVGPAVENPAIVAVNGRLYAFGGSSSPFSGAVARSAVYDPASDTWTSLPDIPTPRGGALAVHVAGKIYVIGGMTGDGASSAVVEVFDVASRSWSAGPSMSTARDNPGGAAIDGQVYIFGGRTRLASGSTVNGALNTVESLDPSTGFWTARAPMPTGRRTMGSAVVDGRAILLGGEGGTDGNAFKSTERYDPTTDTWQSLWPMPTPRHGAVTAVVDGLVHILGGGPMTGSAWTDKHEVLRPPA